MTHVNLFMMTILKFELLKVGVDVSNHYSYYKLYTFVFSLIKHPSITLGAGGKGGGILPYKRYGGACHTFKELKKWFWNLFG